MTSEMYDRILTMLKIRPYSDPESSGKLLIQCKNDTLTTLTQATPVEFRYIDHTSSLSNPNSHMLSSPVDDDIAMFATSVLRVQLEIDLMLYMKQLENREQQQLLTSQQHAMFGQSSQFHTEANSGSNSINFKKKRSCFSKYYSEF